MNFTTLKILALMYNTQKTKERIGTTSAYLVAAKPAEAHVAVPTFSLVFLCYTSEQGFFN